MNDFWKSYDITHAEYGADYRCYPLYGTVHLIELAISLAFIVAAFTSQNWLFRLHSLQEWLGGIAAALPAPGGAF